MPNFKDLLMDIKQKRGWSQRLIAEKLGITENHVSRIVNGKFAPSHQLEESIALLHKAEFDIQPQTVVNPVPNIRMAPAPVYRPIPVISWARAGSADFSYGDLDGQIDETVLAETRDPNAFALILEGNSMEPQFPAGCRIIAEPNSEARNGNLVVARLSESGGVIFKKFKQTGRDGCTIRLESVNPDYSPLEYPLQSFRWIYPIVEVVVKLRR